MGYYLWVSMINFDKNKYPNPNRSFVLKQLGGQTKQQTNIFDKQANDMEHFNDMSGSESDISDCSDSVKMQVLEAPVKQVTKKIPGFGNLATKFKLEDLNDPKPPQRPFFDFNLTKGSEKDRLMTENAFKNVIFCFSKDNDMDGDNMPEDFELLSASSESSDDGAMQSKQYASKTQKEPLHIKTFKT